MQNRAARRAERIAGLIDAINDSIGRAVAWTALAMVLVQFLVVLLRHVYGVGLIFLQESIIYLHALLFMLGGGYTLLRDGHVRVDIFYARAGPRRRAWANLLGVVFFLVPVTLVVLVHALPYVAKSWAVWEGSRETSGIPAIFLLKTVIPVFAGLVLLQGIALALRSILVLSQRAPDGRGGTGDAPADGATE